MLQALRRELWQYLEATNNKTGNIEYPDSKGRRPLFLVAFSGGRDSVALLAALDELRHGSCADLPAAARFALAAAHFNHCLRGAEADGDQDFCRDFCAARGIEFHIGRQDVRALAAGENIENAARRLRYAWLHSVCRDYRSRGYGPVWLVSAHHRYDQAETVLLHLLRGGGSTGLAAMRGKSGDLLRPLLHISRTDIEEYLQSRGLDWREDSTNASMEMTRNRLRRQIIPLLREINPQLTAALDQTASVLAAEDDFLGALAKEKLQAAVLGDGRAEYPLALLGTEHLAVQRRLVRLLWCHAAACAVCGLTFEQTDGILKLKPGKALHCAGGIEASVCGAKGDRRLVLRRFSDEERRRRADKSRSGQPD